MHQEFRKVLARQFVSDLHNRSPSAVMDGSIGHMFGDLEFHGFTVFITPSPPLLPTASSSRASLHGLCFPQHCSPIIVELLTRYLASTRLRQKLPVIVRSRLGNGWHDFYQNPLFKATTSLCRFKVGRNRSSLGMEECHKLLPQWTKQEPSFISQNLTL